MTGTLRAFAKDATMAVPRGRYICEGGRYM